jgi:hypothetical protein
LQEFAKLLALYSQERRFVFRSSFAELAANVDAGRITAADQDPTNWLTYGRTYGEQVISTDLLRLTPS